MEPLFTPICDDPTKQFGLLGHPVAHSLSPRIHNTAFQALNLPYQYDVFDVKKEQMKDAVETIRMLEIPGCNLTMPLKEAVVPYLDELSPSAHICGSVNTIVNQGGKLIGHSTDGAGFMKALEADGIHLKGHSMTILGAGGAARSIIAQAALDGLTHISVFKRKNQSFLETVEYAKKVNKETTCQVSIHDFSDTEDFLSCLSASNLLCNATNVGMESPISLVPDTLLRQDLIVVDIIYQPSFTRLLQDAKKKGAHFMNGIPMLLQQAALSFELWTNQKMPLDVIRKEVKEVS